LPDFGDEVQVIAKICANVIELEKRMKRDGCLEKEDDLRDFIQGFSTGLSGFDFVDTGSEEGRKEDKIRGILPSNHKTSREFCIMRSHF
jgi:hypothetical protein